MAAGGSSGPSPGSRTERGFSHTYCNTIPTALGGSHEAGLRQALMRGLRAHGERVGNRKVGRINADDAIGGAGVMLSVFIRNPQFQGQTKEKLESPETQRMVELTIKDRFDHWLAADTGAADAVAAFAVERAEDRQRRREERDRKRKVNGNRRARLPGKLTDCSRRERDGTEIFLVEGDSAGGSAKQARQRETQAILPLRGKILNVASATDDKLRANREIADPPACARLRHGRVILRRGPALRPDHHHDRRGCGRRPHRPRC